MAIELNTPLSSGNSDNPFKLSKLDLNSLQSAIGPSVFREIISRNLSREEIQAMVLNGKLLAMPNVGVGTVSKICNALRLVNPIRKKQKRKNLPSSFDAEQLLVNAESQPLLLFAGIYILYQSGIVKYVGQSINVIYRIAQHLGVKPFDDVKTITVKTWSIKNPLTPEELPELQGRLLSMESALIKHFKPEWNG